MMNALIVTLTASFILFLFTAYKIGKLLKESSKKD